MRTEQFDYTTSIGWEVTVKIEAGFTIILDQQSKKELIRFPGVCTIREINCLVFGLSKACGADSN